MKRPWPVVFLAVLECAAAAMAIVVSISLLMPGTRLDRMWDLNPAAQAAFASSGRQIAVLLLFIGALAAAAGIGLLTRRLWAWLLSLAIFGINALGDAVSLLVTHDWARGLAGIAIDALFIYLLLSPGVRAYFLRRSR
ncbi:MAG: hypothetical protein ACLGXA_20370 [Acidobacteriota bacterium]